MVCDECHGRRCTPAGAVCRGCAGSGRPCGEGEREQPPAAPVPPRESGRPLSRGGAAAANSWHALWWEDYCRRTGLLPGAIASV